jgi:hypothetical protein
VGVNTQTFSADEPRGAVQVTVQMVQVLTA